MTFFTEVWEIISKYYEFLLKGMGLTLLIALVGTVIGLVIGLLTGIVRTTPFSKNGVIRVLHKILNAVISIYVEIFRGTPMMVQAMVIYWGYAFMNDGTALPLVPAGIFIVSINTGAYMAEIVRGGIISIDKGQFEGAHSVGMSHFQTMRHVILPQAVRNIMPSIGNEFVVNIKDSSVLSVIAITELMFIAKQAGGTYAKFVPAYVICAIIYFVLTFTVTRLLRLIEKKLTGSSSYTICGSQSDPDAEIHVKEVEV